MQTIHLDISNKGAIPIVYAKQSDVGRKIAAVITDNGVPYKIPNTAMLSVWYDGDSGSGNYTDIGDKSAISVDNNKITIELIEQMLSCAGDGMMTVLINSENGEQIGLWNIEYRVDAIPGFGSEKAEEYYTAFSQMANNLYNASKVFFVDKSLSKEGNAADAAVTGTAIRNLGARVDNLSTLKDGSTTGDAELIDGRVGIDGVIHQNIGEHIRDISKELESVKKDQAQSTPFGVYPITVARDHSGWSPGNDWKVSYYDYVVRFFGSNKYLQKIVLPLMVNLNALQNNPGASFDFVIGIDQKESGNVDQPISFKEVTLTSESVTQNVEIDVNKWLSDGDLLRITVMSIGEVALCPLTNADFDVDWLSDGVGHIYFIDHETLTQDNIRFSGELIFYDNLREDVKTLSENTVSYNPQDKTAEQKARARKNLDLYEVGEYNLAKFPGEIRTSGVRVGSENAHVHMESFYDEDTPILVMADSQGNEPVVLSGIANPTSAGHAANKQYVDNSVAPTLHYTEQALTPEQQTQARKNLGLYADYYHSKIVPLTEGEVDILEDGLKTSNIYTYYANLKATKNTLGKDASGKDINEYEFSVGDYTSGPLEKHADDVHKPKFLILSGIHGDERAAVFAVEKFFEDFVVGLNLPSYFKEGAIFKVIPVANPWGFDNKTHLNKNGVNLNRNFDYQWDKNNEDGDLNTNIGSSAASEPETQIIAQWLNDNKDAIAFVEVHCSGRPDEYVGIIGAGQNPDVKKAKEIALRGLDKVVPYWKSSHENPDNFTFCYSANLDTWNGTKINGPAVYYASEKLGIPSISLEIKSPADFSITAETAEEMAIGAEVLGNILLELYSQAMEQHDVDGWFEIKNITTTEAKNVLDASTYIPCKQIVAQMILPEVLTGKTNEFFGVGPGQYNAPYAQALPSLDAKYRTYRLSVEKGMFAELSAAYTTDNTFWAGKVNARLLRSDDNSTKDYFYGFRVQRGDSADTYPIGTQFKVWGLKA